MNNIEELTDAEFEYLVILHRRCWIDGKLMIGRYETFKKKVLEYENKGRKVCDFKRYFKVYEKELENNDLLKGGKNAKD